MLGRDSCTTGDEVCLSQFSGPMIYEFYFATSRFLNTWLCLYIFVVSLLKYWTIKNVRNTSTKRLWLGKTPMKAWNSTDMWSFGLNYARYSLYKSRVTLSQSFV